MTTKKIGYIDFLQHSDAKKGSILVVMRGFGRKTNIYHIPSKVVNNMLYRFKRDLYDNCIAINIKR